MARKREQNNGQGRDEDSVLGSSSDLVHSSASREEINDVYADPAYQEGDYVLISRDTRPGVSKSVYSHYHLHFGKCSDALHLYLSLTNSLKL